MLRLYPSLAFLPPPPVLVPTHRACCNIPPQCPSTRPTIHMNTSPALGRVSLYTGITLLTALLTNRLAFTPLDTLSLTQSRSDILGVLTSATLVLYAVGKAEIAAKPRQAVQLDGFDIRQGFQIDPTGELQWMFTALMAANRNIRSCALFLDQDAVACLGRFRTNHVHATTRQGGVIQTALLDGKRAYLADMKTVPVKDLEFGFLPANCQAVIVQPVSPRAVVVLGADKPRPFRPEDFGWLQAIADRMAGLLAAVEV
eukprot:GFKZ01011595.1.p1 GENE.GFKZ01011595.1~~GFKZ01011595.1.p1  ORF type:complete len:257 (+),score=25.16 GFKZ01011595.1:249-1019(+)